MTVFSSRQSIFSSANAGDVCLAHGHIEVGRMHGCNADQTIVTIVTIVKIGPRLT